MIFPLASPLVEDCSHQERKEHPNYCFECIKAQNMKKKTSMKKEKKIEKENIIVPIEWLSNLAKYAEFAEKDKNYVVRLIGFASSAKILLKYGIRR